MNFSTTQLAALVSVSLISGVLLTIAYVETLPKPVPAPVVCPENTQWFEVEMKKIEVEKELRNRELDHRILIERSELVYKICGGKSGSVSGMGIDCS